MALPYVDDIEASREQVNALLAEEMGSMGKPSQKQYLSHLPLPKAFQFERTSMVKHHLQEMEEGSYKSPEFDTYRYDLPAPSQALKNDPEAWKESVKNAYAQLEHQRNRIDNLELMTQFGGQKWTRYVEQLQALQNRLQAALDAINQDMEDINWQRQNEQQAAGQEFYQLEVRWGELVAANYQLETICRAIEQQQPQQEEAAKEE
ncbi:hypothetical protein PTSG_09200 [Salpingoeca rosetta]|uniref:Pre-mRNA-splicing factor SPF27 n=1 Tax=Salpingoeca rosetta (strain ATCC 50818 / BSB-021) TaxID=946362 RepID=F2UN03_SALR5|nr:uncharacterized protein PTSG_09200 [Salpingoeca rosetta]EGD78502.1 hypothetical protein PTSG_09200 [Salpingoeca rosetta]|eukprot:XP_004989451.1 hypothetical protein PTSG_09200 [Salpingoeca rosetta]